MDISRPLTEARKEAVASVERQYLMAQLAAHKGRIDATAKATGISVRQLHKLLTKYKIKKADYKPPKTAS